MKQTNNPQPLTDKQIQQLFTDGKIKQLTDDQVKQLVTDERVMQPLTDKQRKQLTEEYFRRIVMDCLREAGLVQTFKDESSKELSEKKGGGI